MLSDCQYLLLTGYLYRAVLLNLSDSTCSNSSTDIQWNQNASLLSFRTCICKNVCFILPVRVTRHILFLTKASNILFCSASPTSMTSFKDKQLFFLELMHQTLSIPLCFVPFLNHWSKRYVEFTFIELSFGIPSKVYCANWSRMV